MADKKHNSPTTAGVKLTRHVRGWVAKIGGRVKWLAPLDKPALALERYHEKMAAHLAGSIAAPTTANNNATIGQLGDLFLSAKAAKVAAGEMKARTLADYKAAIQRAIDTIGKGVPALMVSSQRWMEYRNQLAVKMDPHSLGRYVGAIRTLSKWASQNEYIDRPFRFGTEFTLPSQKALRKNKEDAGKRVFSNAEVASFVKACDPVLRAVFMLAINGGIGNTDLAVMRIDDVDLVNGEIRFNRSKTGVGRLIPLWPETVKAIREALPFRPDTKNPAFADLVFLTPRGFPLVREQHNEAGELTSWTDSIGMRFSKVAKAAKIDRTFYDARRTFQTIGDERGPAHVVKAIMGHAGRGDDMSARYRQSIPRAELEAVVNHVRKSLNISKIVLPVPVKAAAKAKVSTRGRRNEKTGKPAHRTAEIAK